MRWDKEVESKLKEYPRKLNAVTNLKHKISYLSDYIYTLKGSFRDTDPVQGGGCKQEDILLDRIVEKEELEKNLEYIEHEISWIQKGFTCLTDIEYKVIQQMYLNESRMSVDNICKSLGYEKSQVYNIRNTAVEKMTLELYGKIYS